MVAARFNANIGYRVFVTGQRSATVNQLPFGAFASNDDGAKTKYRR